MRWYEIWVANEYPEYIMFGCKTHTHTCTRRRTRITTTPKLMLIIIIIIYFFTRELGIKPCVTIVYKNNNSRPRSTEQTKYFSFIMMMSEFRMIRPYVGRGNPTIDMLHYAAYVRSRSIEDGRQFS